MRQAACEPINTATPDKREYVNELALTRRHVPPQVRWPDVPGPCSTRGKIRPVCPAVRPCIRPRHPCKQWHGRVLPLVDRARPAVLFDRRGKVHSCGGSAVVPDRLRWPGMLRERRRLPKLSPVELGVSQHDDSCGVHLQHCRSAVLRWCAAHLCYQDRVRVHLPPRALSPYCSAVLRRGLH
jgi:hypothetical protein